jgi:hypothetical protein
MKILDTPDSQSLLTQMTALDVQIQDRFSSFYDDSIPEMQRWWFAQPADHVAKIVRFRFWRNPWVVPLAIRGWYGSSYGLHNLPTTLPLRPSRLQTAMA